MTFKNKTSKINPNIVEKISEKNCEMRRLGLMQCGFSGTIDKIEECNNRYIKAEIDAINYIEKGESIPDELENFLIDTLEDRKNWHSNMKYLDQDSDTDNTYDNLDTLFVE